MNAELLEKIVIDNLSVVHVIPQRKSHELPIVFVHGAWGGKWQFENWQRYAAQHEWESYALDVRGHNESLCTDFAKVSVDDYAKDVEKVVETIGPCYLLGHSMGGLVVQLAASRSTNVKKVILLASTAPGKMFYINAYSLRMVAYAPGALLRGTITPKRSDMERFFGPIPRDILDLFVPESIRAGIDIVFKRIKKQNVTCPVLVVASEKDQLIPLSVVRKLSKIYSADYIELPGTGHFAMLEPNWQDPIERILEWLDHRA